MSRFWERTRQISKVVSDAFNGASGDRNLTQPAREASPLQRAQATGSVQSWPIGNLFEQLNHGTSWTGVGVHTVGKQWALASACVYQEQRQVNKSHASHAADAPAERRSPVHGHDILKLLKRPNPVMDGLQFMYLAGVHFRLTGGCLIWEVRNEEGQPKELWLLPRAWTTFQQPREGYPMGLLRVQNRGMVAYWGNSPLAGGFYIDVRDTIAPKWPHALFPGEPFSLPASCGRIVDIMEQTDLAVWSVLQDAPIGNMVLMLAKDVIMTDEEKKRLVAKIHQEKSGAHNAGKTILLEAIEKIDQFGTKLSELDAVPIRKQNQEFGLGIQGIPSVASGLRSETGSYAGDAASFNAFAELGIQPDLDVFASAMTHRFNRYWPGTEVEFAAKRYDDPTLDLQKAKDIFAAIDKGAASKNEWRSVLKLPPIPGGDVYEVAPPPQPTSVNFHAPGGAAASGAAGGPGDENGIGEDDLSLDMDDEMGDETSTGMKRPDLQVAGGRSRMPSLNGNGKH